MPAPSFYTWPLVSDTPIGVLDASNAATTEVLGRDVFYDGDQKVTAKGDYATVEGLENYRRAIMRRLITSPGTYRLRPGYGVGLGDFIKKKMTKSIIDQITTRVREQVAADRRTEKVIAVVVTELTGTGQQGLKISITVQAFGRTLRPLAFSFSREA